MEIRRLNQEGIEKFEAFLDALLTDHPDPYPESLLTDAIRTERIKPAIQIELRPFTSRFDLARYLYNLFRDATIPGLDQDRGLWTWLALFYFEKICAKNSLGQYRPGERARWVLNVASRRYYRHIMAGPYFVYRKHADNPERVRGLLCNPPNELSDVFLEIADSQQLITNPAIVEAATLLYYNPRTGKLKSGTARDKPGGARRFAQVLSQFDCTWDLYAMDVYQILDLLPDEFDRFKPETYRKVR
ncbi:MAG TPA: hypothetical protein PLO53_03345 [Candidatus Hydrogenedentes bacterium]|nr:hypothetical protein [Candidatus Hydrogenedentota bacterium]